MARDSYRQGNRTRLMIALGVSAGVHAAGFAYLKLDVTVFDRTASKPEIQLVDIGDDWKDRALEVVALESAPRVPSTRPSGVASEAAATSARTDASEPGAGGADAMVAAIVPMSSLPSAAPNDASLDLTFAEPAEAPTVLAVVAVRSNRGIIKRESGGGAAAVSGFDFIAASDAARDAERERGGGGWGGAGGIGVTILGGGGHCPPGAAPGLLPGLGALGGLGGVPTVGRGMGLIGNRPSFGGAVNRFGPRR